MRYTAFHTAEKQIYQLWRTQTLSVTCVPLFHYSDGHETHICWTVLRGYLVCQIEGKSVKRVKITSIRSQQKWVELSRSQQSSVEVSRS